MSKRPLNIEELRVLIHKGEAKDPLVFLESIVSGKDLRNLSGIYSLMMDIDDFAGGDIGKEDWNEVLDYVVSNYKYRTVSLADSMSAAKTVTEYLHPKRKHIETTNVDKAADPNANPLTEEEIELFKEKFNDEF